MKKIARMTAILGVAVLLAGLAGCAAPVSAGADDGRLQVICTVFPAYDFVRQTAGAAADVSMMLPPGAEAHNYEPTAQDMIAISGCDLFIYAGGENDTWVTQLLESLDRKPDILAMLDCVEGYEEEIGEGMQAAEEDEQALDEHVWTSPAQARQVVTSIASAMASLDPENAAIYEENAAVYDAELAALSDELRGVIEGAKRREIIVGDRFPFLYLAKDYGLTYYAAFPGCGGESEPSAQTMAFLTDKVKSDGIPAVFYIEFSSRRVADALAEACGVKTLLLHSCHTVSAQELEEGVTYLSLMRGNLENLREALS